MSCRPSASTHGSSVSSVLAGEGLRKGLRDMQQHASRQTAGRKEAEGGGLPDSVAASQADAEHNLKRPETPQKDPSGSTFLQSLKARYAVPLSAYYLKAFCRGFVLLQPNLMQLRPFVSACMARPWSTICYRFGLLAWHVTIGSVLQGGAVSECGSQRSVTRGWQAA